jgi:hypothetical protein
MKETNLNIFYHLGESLNDLGSHLQTGMELGQLYSYLILAENWVLAFLKETEELLPMLKETRISAQTLLGNIQAVKGATFGHWMRKITPAQMNDLLQSKEQLENNFEHENRNLSVFTVTRKGIYDTRALIETPEQKFPEQILPFLPQQMLEDFKQAARCLAFGIPTACAFHVCRGTEALIIQYCERLLGHPWAEKRKDWSRYIEVLIEKEAPEQITSRLREIAKMDRNAYVHPDKTVSLDEAPLLFDLCAAVIFYMGQELGRLTP